MKITYVSKHGKEKTESQDCILVNDEVINDYAGRLDVTLERLCIADGVGGVPGGYEASSFVLKNFINKKIFKSVEELREHLLNINDELIKYASKIPEKKAMATTFTGIVRIDKKIYLMHAGNTRLYAVKEKEVVQISTDHTNYQAMVVDGVISKDEEYVGKNVIYCCFGTGNREYLNALQVEEIKLKFSPEYLLFTSDGIHDYVDDEKLKQILDANKDDRNKILSLLDEAQTNGSGDDCTVVVARITD